VSEAFSSRRRPQDQPEARYRYWPHQDALRYLSDTYIVTNDIIVIACDDQTIFPCSQRVRPHPPKVSDGQKKTFTHYCSTTFYRLDQERIRLMGDLGLQSASGQTKSPSQKQMVVPQIGHE